MKVKINVHALRVINAHALAAQLPEGSPMRDKLIGRAYEQFKTQEPEPIEIPARGEPKNWGCE